MSLFETIKNRRSIHVFKNEEVDENILRNIFTYASYAPSHYMKESWNIKLYQKKGKVAFVREILNSYVRIGMIPKDGQPKTEKMMASIKKFLEDIPHHALIYFEKPEDPIRYEEEYASICAFIQNAQLAAWEYGVGMLWTITPYMHDAKFYETVGLNADKHKIAAVMQIGYPKKIPRAKPRTPIAEKLHIIDEPF